MAGVVPEIRPTSITLSRRRQEEVDAFGSVLFSRKTLYVDIAWPL